MQARVAIVTGGASGIGRAAVELLAKANWRVTIADRSEEGAAVAAELSADGHTVQFVRTDVNNEDQVKNMVSSTLAAYGRLDGAINSAGVEHKGRPIHELEAVDWDRCVDINLRGMFLCIRHQAAAMVAQRSGSIVAISSAAATMALIHSVEYCASKAGVTGLVRGAALDLAEYNVRVNALLPGATVTPLAKRSTAANPNVSQTVPIPIKRMARPPEIAAFAVWLLSDEASYVTGASLTADGGMSIA